MDPSDKHERERGAYELEPEPETPNLPGSAVIVRRDAEELHDVMASELVVHARNCVRQFGDFHLALSGGSTPLPLYTRLMVDPAFRDLPWAQTHLWMVDERRVPLDDEKSNFRHIRELIVEHSGIPREQAHEIDATADDADVRYERELRETLGWRERGHDRLDYVLLGMGGDGHTASLFPNSAALEEKERLVVINDGPGVTPPPRVTMTYPLINAARFIALLVTGEGKREAVGKAASGQVPVREIPVLGVNPVGGVMRWYLDHDACPR